MSRQDILLGGQPYSYGRKIGFWSSVVWALCTLCVTGILGGTALGLYGLNVLDRRSRDLGQLVQDVVTHVPELRSVLPAAIVDPFNDQRQPDYLSQLKLEVTPAVDDVTRRTRPTITVTNNGDQVVSLLGLRVVALNDSGDPIGEQTTYVATPLAIEDEWRGPLLPSSQRRFSLPAFLARDPAELTWEVTDLRVWSETDKS